MSGEVKQEYNEWLLKVLLSHFKTLSVSTINNADRSTLENLRSQLIEGGITEEEMQEAVLEYEKLTDDERNKELEDKAITLVSKIDSLLNENKVVDTKDYPEFYYRIQEILILAPTIDDANNLIHQTFDKANIEEHVNCTNRLYGENCSFFYVKKKVQ